MILLVSTARSSSRRGNARHRKLKWQLRWSLLRRWSSELPLFPRLLLEGVVEVLLLVGEALFAVVVVR